MITRCPRCDTELPDTCIEARINKDGNLAMRPIKKPWKACPIVACRRVTNTVTGEVWKSNKLEIKPCIR